MKVKIFDNPTTTNPINYSPNTKTGSCGSLKWTDIIGIPQCITDCSVLEEFILSTVGAGQAISFLNGLTKNNITNEVKLGGTLVNNTLIDSPTSKTFEINLGGGLSHGAIKINPFATYTVRLAYSDGNFANDHSYGIGLGGHGLFYSAGSSYFTIMSTVVNAGVDYPTHNTLFLIGDGLYNRGAEYGGDYEANFVARSLVTKRYVDGKSTVGGEALFNGNAINTTFSIPHGLSGTPAKINVTAGSVDGSNFDYITKNATHITVVYDTAPPAGVNNVSLHWIASLS